MNSEGENEIPLDAFGFWNSLDKHIKENCTVPGGSSLKTQSNFARVERKLKIIDDTCLNFKITELMC